jgi:pilus assembly protein Flp/PilA
MIENGSSQEQIMKVLKQFFLRLWTNQQGQDLVEYALIVAAVGLALITTVNQLTTAVVSLYSSITQGLASIGAAGQ